MRIYNAECRNVIFRTVPLVPKQVVALYYVTLVYDNLYVVVPCLPSIYGKCVLAVQVKRSVKLGMELDVKTSTGTSILVFASPSFPVSYINDPRYTNAEPRGPTAEQLAANPNTYWSENVSYEYKSIKNKKTGIF